MVDVRPIAARKVALVFRSVGERTSELAETLAIKYIRPDIVHRLVNIRPFSATVSRMLELDFGDCETVVAVDADCLILEDMRPFLDRNDEAYVDCFVHDRFRGRIHCGVHITRVDVIAQMRRERAPVDEEPYVLRPESRLRKLALTTLGHSKSLKGFDILHDHLQWHADIFAKYVLRELRSRSPQQREKLEWAMARWRREEERAHQHQHSLLHHAESRAALRGVSWARANIPEGVTPSELADAIAELPRHAAHALDDLALPEQPPLAAAELEHAASTIRRGAQLGPEAKVFGLGLSRTGTRSLTSALHALGIDTVHYPIDRDSLRALTSGALDFALLDAFDGLTDITVSTFYEQLDRMFPDARFVLTVREKTSWLRSCANHWQGRDAFESPTTETRRVHMEVRRFLRAATYGAYDFSEARFSRTYDKHVADVQAYFAGRPGKLLVLNVVDGDGWAPLADFFGEPIPDQPFPHKGGGLSAKLAKVGDPDD